MKDPLTLHYSMLSDPEMFVLRSLNGKMAPVHVLRQLRETWPASGFTMLDLRDLIQQFLATQLVLGSAASASAVQMRRGILFWFAKLAEVLRLRIPLINPDRWLDQISPWLRLLFHPIAPAILVFVMLLGLTVVCVRFGDFIRCLPGLNGVTTGDNLLMLFVAFVVIKGLHEFGHAATAKHFGAECNEAGIWLLMFTPILYTNVTDSWLLPQRQRLLVTAAGILTELIIASLAAILWSMTNPGMIQSLLANIVVMCTINTILFNGNPLLRYDGYFLLTDAISLPNLAQRSAFSVQQFMERLLLGPVVVEPDAKTTDCSTVSGRHGFILGYGLLSMVYRAVLTLTILVLFMKLFDRWNLRVLGVGLMTLGAVSMVLLPATRNATSFLGALFSRRNPRGSGLRAISICAAIVGMFFIPLPRSVVAPAVIEPHGKPVFAVLTGQLRQAIDYGTPIRRGDVIATLSEPQLQRELLQLRSDVTVREQQLRALELSRDSASQSMIPEIRSSLEGTRSRLKQFETEVGRLTIRAAEDGVLRPPRPMSRSWLNSDDLSFWTGLVLDQRNLGATIAEGTLLGYLDPSGVIETKQFELSDGADSDPSRNVSQVQRSERFELLLSLTDRNRQRVLPKQLVEFCPTGNPGVSWRGVVREVASLQVSEVSAELVAAGLDSEPTTMLPQDEGRRWQAIVDVIVSNNQTSPILYSTGEVRIHIAPASIAARLEEFIRETFR